MTIKEIFENKDKLIAEKMEAIKYADLFGTAIEQPKQVNKADKQMKSNEIEIVGNTYLWMDSHKDVHALDCFKDSLEENSKIFHLHDHEFKITSQVGKAQRTYESRVAWKDLGVDKDGETQALFMVSEISPELNKEIYKGYMSGEIDQHSVGMRYDDIALAINNEEYEEEKALWDEYYSKLGNQETADKYNYFWVVKKATLVEISCVLKGSNSLTPTWRKQVAKEELKAEKDALKSLIDELKSIN